MHGVKEYIKEHLKTEKLYKRYMYMGIGFLNLLTIIFIVAKLLGFINASWLIVFLPTIISAVLTVLLVVVALITQVIVTIK